MTRTNTRKRNVQSSAAEKTRRRYDPTGVKITPWTHDEINYLTTLYGRLPADRIAELINKRFNRQRSRQAIVLKACKLMISDSAPENMTRLSWAYPRALGGAMNRIIAAAKADGVLRQQLGARGKPYIAPTKWVDAYVEQLQAQPRDEHLDVIRREWMRSAEAADMYNIPRKRFAAKALSNRGWLKDHLPKAVRYHRDIQSPGQPIYWHPGDLRAFLPKWAAYKRSQAHVKPTDNLIRNHPKERQ